ncbi:amino acid/amide ABC transporter ATP-binding protein 1, HAAT family [Limimonas halophila]|uniref:Amino acid/amide ABC transporter ATP-binding protein 1, HAAT family n=1 Tax=Limimonas halophila TaxID=1082479 RepID=A0A1G7NWN5_9PROT|nr:ABC transporter ATP-binding protein [Limimonas halophila]SDF78455.1 amino acid/amide ABC transporter ATP-binding protein 1, HAAT family [Limimonas halophila]
MIEVRDIVKRFGGLVAVDHCSLTVGKGTITGLIGPNGAGKSTLFNIVAGFLQPDDGSVLLDGEDVTSVSPHRLFRKGLVRTFQIPHELARMSVLENLMLVPAEQSGENLFNAWFRPARTRGDEARVRERAEQALETLQLTHVRHELAGNLSGGQKKLLEIGRTMMTDARVVLLDEPGAGVNRTLMAQLTDVIRTLNREHGYTFCIIEHDMDMIGELCDPVICMAQGHVLAQGSMAEIRSNEAVLEAYFGGGAATAADASA